MVKRGGLSILLLLLISFSFVVAEYNSTDVEKAYDCLESTVDDCSGLATSEMAFVVLATPDGATFDSCVNKLESAKVGDSWGNVKDTALALLALDHAGKDTTSIENWLESVAKNSSDLEWHVILDTEDSTTCSIKYDNQTYGDIVISEDKTLSSGAGSCLVRDSRNLDLILDSSCHGKNIEVECIDDFIVAFNFIEKSQPLVLNALDDTLSASGYGSVNFGISSRCFGEGSSCDFETSAWATYALLEAGVDIGEYMPYLFAVSGSNAQYVPSAFLYILKKYDVYSANLIKDQGSSGYWDISGSPYGKFYDSALAVLALGVNQQSVLKTLDWFYYSADSEGCIGGSTRDLAIVLWATEQRAGRASGGSTQIHCEDVENQDYFCVPYGECSGEQLDNFFCSSSVCCTEDVELLSCVEQNGSVCNSGQTCAGSSSSSSDELSCCLGDCIDSVELSECELADNTCQSSCGSNEVVVNSLTCDDSGDVCCDYVGSVPSRDSNDSDGGSLWWIWLLIILILAVTGALAWFYRDKLKALFNKNNNSNSDQGGMPPRGPGIPPRNGPPGYNRQMMTSPNRKQAGLPPKPGFPPVRR
jgi:hypothetical protein